MEPAHYPRRYRRGEAPRRENGCKKLQGSRVDDLSRHGRQVVGVLKVSERKSCRLCVRFFADALQAAGTVKGKHPTGAGRSRERARPRAACRRR